MGAKTYYQCWQAGFAGAGFAVRRPAVFTYGRVDKAQKRGLDHKPTGADGVQLREKAGYGGGRVLAWEGAVLLAGVVRCGRPWTAAQKRGL